MATNRKPEGNLAHELDGRSEIIPLVRACGLLKLTYQQVYGRVLSGRLPAERIDGRWYIKTTVVQRLLTGDHVQPTNGEGDDSSRGHGKGAA